MLLYAFLFGMVIHMNIQNNPREWILHNERPNDPTFSCYQLKNASWVCMKDDHSTYDPEDSY